MATRPRAIEVGFPIAEVNRLAAPERTSYKPIYEMHRWFARRSSSVFRAILLAALKPAGRPDGTNTDLMEDYYRDHGADPETSGKRIFDPFMGGGTTVVEALRLGCRVTGIDLNPVAWFVVKSEVEPASTDELRLAVERLAYRPVDWNAGKPLRETLLSLYRTELELPTGRAQRPAASLEADVIYTYWVKHAICAACSQEVPLFADYVLCRMAPSVRYFREAQCPECSAAFDWEIEPATLVADQELSVNAARGSAGEGRPSAVWAYARRPGKAERARVQCPHCDAAVAPKPKESKTVRKKVPLVVLLCPECRAVWQWRGPLPETPVACPSCRHEYEPLCGNVPEDGKYRCRCGHQGRIIDSIRALPEGKRLPVRPFAQQALFKPKPSRAGTRGPHQPALFPGTSPSAVVQLRFDWSADLEALGLVLPKNARFFKRFTPSDEARLQDAERIWRESREGLPHPTSNIPPGDETDRLLDHHYNVWHDMFLPRQLLALATLLRAIGKEGDAKMQELLLCGLSGALEGNNQFTRFRTGEKTPRLKAEGIFARHDFQLKMTFAESNVWGIPDLAMGTFESRLGLLLDGLAYRAQPWESRGGSEPEKVAIDAIRHLPEALLCQNSAEYSGQLFDLVITDPPYVGNINYSELSNFYYVWLRLALKDRYPHFLPEYVPTTTEIVENRSQGKSRKDFFENLAVALERFRGLLVDDGLLVFTFHHTDKKGDVWEGLLNALCESGYEIVAVYPVHGEAESSLHLQGKENVSYDLIHVCRKRPGRDVESRERSWAGIRQEVRRRARAEIEAIESGRYGGEPLSPADVRLICIGKCLELFSRHFGEVIGRDSAERIDLRRALEDIGTIVDQLVTKERPLPAELEDDLDAVSYAWFRVFLPVRSEIRMDEVHKALRGMHVSPEELRRAGLIVRGRASRGRTYEVRSPRERLDGLLTTISPETSAGEVSLVDLVHFFLGLSAAGAPAMPWVRRFWERRHQIAAALRYCREQRKDWTADADRVLDLLQETPMFETASLPSEGSR